MDLQVYHLFGKEWLIRFTVHVFHERLSICVCPSFPFWFLGWDVGFDSNTLLFDFGNYYFPRKTSFVLQIFTTKSHMWFCPTKHMPGIGLVEHNL